MSSLFSCCRHATGNAAGPVLADNALQIRSVELPELSGTRALWEPLN